MKSIQSKLTELLQQDDLLRSSLLLGKIEDPDFDMQPYVDRVLRLASKVWNKSSRVRKDPIFVAKNICDVLFCVQKLQGKTEKYKHVIDDPNRFYLHSVLKNKVGSSLSLTVLFSILAEQVGLEHECISLPAYFLVKIWDSVSEYYIDVFDCGKILSPVEFQKRFRSSLQKSHLLSTNIFEKLSRPQLVARLAQQLKHIHILKGNALQALRAVEALTAVFPQSPELTRDRGILYCEMEYFSKALMDLKSYLKLRPNAEDFGEIKKLACMLKGYREVMN